MNKFKIGSIIEIRDKSSNVHCGLVIAKNEKESDITYLQIISEEQNVKNRDELSLFRIKAGNSSLNKELLVNFKTQITDFNYNCTVVGNINPDITDEILRQFVKYTSNIYFQKKESQKGENLSFIPAASKVINNEELFNMIDASLDMWLTTGRFNDEFEEKIAEFLNIKYAVTVNSGSSANLLALTTLTSPALKERRLKPGDEVITVAAGFPTTVNPIIQNGLVPVFVDVTLGDYAIDTAQIEEALSEKTRAIFVAHTLGNPFNLEKIMEICQKHDLWLIEDNCDSLGSMYKGKFTGTFGHIGTLSFYPAHHITMGEGGAVITNDSELYKIALSFRDWGRDCWCPSGKDNTCQKRFTYQLGNLPYGYDHKFTYSNIGYNLKITDWQAAIGLAQLNKLEFFINKRRENFKVLYEKLKEFEEYLILPQESANCQASWFGFPITVRENQSFEKVKLVSYLEDNNIGTRHLFGGNLLRQPAYVDNNFKIRIRNSGPINSSELSENNYQMLPNTDIIMNNTFWIGVWPGIKDFEINYIYQTIKQFLNDNALKKEAITD